MTEKLNLLVKLENAGVHKSSKWLVRDISFEVSKSAMVLETLET